MGNYILKKLSEVEIDDVVILPNYQYVTVKGIGFHQTYGCYIFDDEGNIHYTGKINQEERNIKVLNY